VLEERQVNILVHGHEPILSEMIVAASRDADLLALARQAGAEGINIAGICCTANEILMRQGMPVAGNYLHQELALLTGAVDLMVVDVQCVMPSLPQVAACHHTKIVTTSTKAHMPAAEQMTLDTHNPKQTARAIVKSAVAAFSRRDPARVNIPRHKMDLVAGFTNENLPHYLGGRFRAGYRPLIDAVAAGRIRGIVGVVGCNNPRVAQDTNHLALVRSLLAQDVLVVQTGCSAIASAKFGLLRRQFAHSLGVRGAGRRGRNGRRSIGAAHRRRRARGHERESHRHRPVRRGFRNLHRLHPGAAHRGKQRGPQVSRGGCRERDRRQVSVRQ
jgi:carbon-monoxide dehydrogenase catalytic subunit